MGIQNLSIRKTATDTRRSWVEINPNDNTTGICFSWDVMVGGTRSWTYGIDVWGVAKGGSSQVSVGSGWHDIEITGTDTGNGAQFQVPVNTVLSTAGLAQYVQAFAARQYDYLRFKFRVRPTEYPVGYTQDIIADVYYVPKFSNVRVGYSDANTLRFTGSTSGWVGGGTIALWQFQPNNWSTSQPEWNWDNRIELSTSYDASGNFTAYLPVSKLATAPKIVDGGTAVAVMGIMPQYTSRWFSGDYTLTTVSYTMGGVTASAVRNSNGSVTITANFGSNTIGSATAKLDGGTLACDTASIKSGSVTFTLAPMRAATYTVTASNASGSAHATVQVSVPAWKSDIARIVRADGSAKVEARYNMAYSSKDEPESETYKLSGRNRPSAYFGEGGECEWSLEYTILTSDTAAASSARALQYGDVFAEFPTGERFHGFVSNVSVDREYGGLSTISIDLMEVA